MRLRFSSAQSALLELGVLFLPGIPALIWLWPGVSGTEWNTPVQAAVYVYLIAGAFFIGLRRWSWDQLGLNRKGILFALACGAVVILGRIVVLLATSIPLGFQLASIDRIIGETVYYFLLVGLGEELIFRGLMYRALDEWRGTRLAIWGSSLGFSLFHLGHGDPTIVVAVFVGALFAAIRWRTGGIVGLIVVHALYDLSVVAIVPDLSMGYLLTQVQIRSWPLIAVGYAMMIGVGIYLWKAPIRREPTQIAESMK
jgi:membrane protease YdiL (CAAX protease family)